MNDFEDCIKKGLIRKTTASKEQASLSLEKARGLLGDAEDDLEEKRYSSATIIGYTAIFNAARALLFRDGYRERSHFCVMRYLESEYANEIGMEMLARLNDFRETRHEVQYSAAYKASEKEAASFIAFAREFIAKVEKLVK